MNRFPPTTQNTPNKSAYEAAVHLANKVASKLQSGGAGAEVVQAGIKRPLSDACEGPDLKKLNMEQDSSTEQVAVPDKMVGMIIGRGGEQITRLQQDSGCKIQMAADSGGQSVRMCTLTGSQQAISQAKAMIDGIIANSNLGMGGGGGGGGGGGAGGGGPPGVFELMIPGGKVGLVIGKGGETIKMLQEQTGAKIIIIQESSDHADEKPLRISGPPDAVENAKGRVMELLNQMDQNGFGGRGRGRGGGMMRGSPRGAPGGFGGRGRGRGGWPMGSDDGEAVDYILVSSDKVGLVIGKGGETIKSINQASGAHCEIDKRAPPEATEKNFIIRGSAENVERAKQMVLEKIGAAPGSGYGAFPGQTFVPSNGSSYQHHPQPVNTHHQPQFQPQSGGAVNPGPGGQPDYSAQWAEYYRSLGMVKEAEQIEQQSGGGGQPQLQPQLQLQPQPQPAAAPQQAAGGPGGEDYSAQWADYYRSVGKIKEAEAIEAQMRSKAGGFQPQPQQYFPAQF